MAMFIDKSVSISINGKKKSARIVAEGDERNGKFTPVLIERNGKYKVFHKGKLIKENEDSKGDEKKPKTESGEYDFLDKHKYDSKYPKSVAVKNEIMEILQKPEFERDRKFTGITRVEPEVGVNGNIELYLGGMDVPSAKDFIEKLKKVWGKLPEDLDYIYFDGHNKLYLMMKR